MKSVGWWPSVGGWTWARKHALIRLATENCWAMVCNKGGTEGCINKAGVGQHRAQDAVERRRGRREACYTSCCDRVADAIYTLRLHTGFPVKGRSSVHDVFDHPRRNRRPASQGTARPNCLDKARMTCRCAALLGCREHSNAPASSRPGTVVGGQLSGRLARCLIFPPSKLFSRPVDGQTLSMQFSSSPSRLSAPARRDLRH